MSLPSSVEGSVAVAFPDPLLTVKEVAERMKVSEQTVTNWFADLPGVQVYGIPRVGKRQYRVIRIPLSVLTKFERQHTNTR